MARLQCLAFSHQLTPPLCTLEFPVTKIISSSTVAMRFPSKSAKRKSRLRPKILKSLTPPRPPCETSTNSEFVETCSENIEAVEDFHASTVSGIPGGCSVIAGKLSTHSILKYGMCILGYFAFQTICAVWGMRNAYSEEKAENSNISQEKNYSSYGNGTYFNGVQSSNVIDLEELELKQKIEEIRAMARDARRVEQKKQEDVNDDEDRDAVPGVEKEIGSRLISLEKRLNSNRMGLLPENMRRLDKTPGQGGDNPSVMSGKMDEETLIFKKKYRFKSSSTMVPPYPKKGFNGVGKRGVSKSGSNGSLRENTTKDADLEQGSSGRKQKRSEELNSLREDEKQSESMHKEARVATSKTVSGSVTGIYHHTRSHQDKKPNASKALGRINQDKKSDNMPDFWWLSLSHVLTVLMKRDVDGGHHEGLFTIRTNSRRGVPDGYIVAFEDQGDANNFCYLLEAFFQDLGDFSADIVPVPTKDLQTLIESDGNKVIVVRKKQLNLYIGQPLAEVESALWSLIETE